MKTPEQTRSGSVALVGAANAGKSTLLNALLGKKIAAVSPRPQTTRHRIAGVRRSGNAELIIYDTPGIEGAQRNGALAGFLKSSIAAGDSDADSVVLVVDVRDVLHDDGKKLGVVLQAMRRPAHFVVINKIDTVEKGAVLRAIECGNAALVAAGHPAAEIVPVSALRRDGVEYLAELLIARLGEGEHVFPGGESTDAPEGLIIAEYIREQLFLRLRQELPYSSAVSVEKTREEQSKGKDVFHIDAVIFVERESQKGIVIGNGGAMLKEIGSAARRELEALFEIQVCLKLHVQVAERWTESDAGLRRVGMLS